MTRSRIAAALALVAALAGACSEEGGDNLGAPCRSDLDCEGALSCDFHGGPIGTCQEAHEHTTSGGS